jgi:hypothetical protein
MTDRSFVYTSRIYHTLKASLMALPVFCIPLALVIYLGRYFGSGAFTVIGGILIFTIPFLFQKRYKLLFTRKAVLEFDSDSFVLKEFSLRDDRLVNEQNIHWINIKKYNFNVSQSGITYINIFFWGGKRKGFSFSEEKNEQQVLSEKSALSIFYYFVSQYNIGRPAEQTIQFRPGFLATNAGRRLLFTLLFVSLGVIIAHVVISPGTSMFSAMSIFIVLGLWAKSKSDSKLYEKMSNLKSRSPYE